MANRLWKSGGVFMGLDFEAFAAFIVVWFVIAYDLVATSPQSPYDEYGRQVFDDADQPDDF
jgi:hypothetical protein